MKKCLWLVLFAPLAVMAQPANSQFQIVNTLPATCSNYSPVLEKASTGVIYTCHGGVYTPAPPGFINQIVVSGSTTTNITFSAIPGTYSSLHIGCQGLSNDAASSDFVTVQFNGDTGTNYSYSYIAGGHSALSSSFSNATAAPAVSAISSSVVSATRASQFTLDVINYAGTTFTKSYQGFGGALGSSAGNIDAFNTNGSWNSTAAITSIKLALATGPDFVAGTTCSLYGLQ